MAVKKVQSSLVCLLALTAVLLSGAVRLCAQTNLGPMLRLGQVPGMNGDFLFVLVLQFINTTTFAARDFWPRRGASDAHTLQGSVRSEQRRLDQKEPPPEGLRRFSVLASLLLGHSPTRGCSLVAPRQNRKSAQQTWSYL